MPRALPGSLPIHWFILAGGMIRFEFLTSFEDSKTAFQNLASKTPVWSARALAASRTTNPSPPPLPDPPLSAPTPTPVMAQDTQPLASWWGRGRPGHGEDGVEVPGEDATEGALVGGEGEPRRQPPVHVLHHERVHRPLAPPPRGKGPRESCRGGRADTHGEGRGSGSREVVWQSGLGDPRERQRERENRGLGRCQLVASD